MLRTSCNEQHSCAGSALVPVGSVLVILSFARAMSVLHAENDSVMSSIPALVPQCFLLVPCW